MKARKIFLACLASVVGAASAYAYEATAKVTFDGNLFSMNHQKGSAAEYSIFNLDEMKEKGTNGISIDLIGALCGGHFDMFYALDGAAKAEDGWSLSAGNTNLWFKPIDELKIKIGYAGDDTFFVERVYNSKVGNPFKNTTRSDDGVTGSVPVYITNSDIGDMGISVAYSPIYDLTVTAAIAPGIGGSGVSFGGGSSATHSAFGVSAKYTWNEFTFQASYRDNGASSWKVLRLGAGYESDSIYAFVQPVIAFTRVSNKNQMDGMCLDLYGEYSIDDMKFTAHLPVTLRLTSDPSYLEYLVKAEYNLGPIGLLDDVTPYVCVESLEAVNLASDFADSFNMSARIGTGFAIGNCQINTACNMNVNAVSSTQERLTWSIPFNVVLEF